MSAEATAKLWRLRTQGVREPVLVHQGLDLNFREFQGQMQVQGADLGQPDPGRLADLEADRQRRLLRAADLVVLPVAVLHHRLLHQADPVRQLQRQVDPVPQLHLRHQRQEEPVHPVVAFHRLPQYRPKCDHGWR
jgi:hypothetical protein